MPLEHLSERRSVLPAKLLQLAPTIADGGQTGRVALDRLRRSSQLSGHILEFHAKCVETGGGRFERCPCLERGECGGHRIEPPTIGGEREDSAFSRLAMAAGVGEQFGLCPEIVVLGGVDDRCGVELIDLEPQQVDLPGSVPLIAAEGRELVLEAAQLASGGAERLDIESAESIEGTALDLG